jgi:two-component system copper resistance phosphate regulon response regulator CusR
MKILVVEDEPKTAAYLRKGLGESGFIIDLATDGDDGFAQAMNLSYDLLILDVMLPRRDGWSLISELRVRGVHTPALFLTARDAVDDRVKGLELGADDYLVKPFAFSELLARVRSVLRRGPERQPKTLQIADLEINLLTGRARRSGQKLDLTAREFALLSFLAQRQGEVVSRTLIAEQVWDMNFDSDSNVVDVAVRRLRIKLDDPYERKLIHTMRGLGYVLEARG